MKKEPKKIDSQIDGPDMQESQEQDDAVIGVFFRKSLLVIAILAVGASVAFFWSKRPVERPQILETKLSGPKVADNSNEPLPPLASFVDVTADTNISFVHENGATGEKLLPETMGGGLALFDYDNDGLIDILLVNSNSWPWNEKQSSSTHKLYRNLGNWQFDDVTTDVGLDKSYYGMGAAIGDFDADGYKDVYITAVGKNHLYRNLQGQRFEEVDLGVAGTENDWGTSAAFFDMDNDGDLDLFVCNYVKWSRDIDFEVDYQLTGVGRAYGPPTNYEGVHSRLYRNDRHHFTDVSAEAGIEINNSATGLPVGKSLAVRPIDLNQDGLLDVIVANDTVQNFVFINLGDGRFDERGTLVGMAFDNSGNATGAMGVDTANYNNDDGIAVAIANFANEMTSFFVSSGGDVFTDESIVSGIGPDSRRALSFGLFFFDYDLDGRSDLLAANGHVEDEINTVQPSQHHEQPGQLFWNCGDRCRRTFVPVSSERSGDLSLPVVGRGAGYADLDDDGDLDVVITQAGYRSLVLRNDQNEGNNWMRIVLRQDGDNIDAIGAQIVVRTDEMIQHQIVMPAKSYLSQVPAALTIGLGKAEKASVTVTWPDGQSTEYADLDVNEAHLIDR